MQGDPVQVKSGVLDIATETALRRVAVSAATAGDHTLVAAVTGQKVKVLGALLIGAGAVSVKFNSDSTALTGVMPLAVEGNGLVMPMTHRGYHWLETAAGAALVLNLSGSVAVTGIIVYLQE
jgi:hypothetical protein